MKKLFCVFGMLVIGLTNNLLKAQTGWIQTSLNAMSGYSLYATDTEIYAATYLGVYSTTDNGTPWFSKSSGSVYDIIQSHQNLLAGRGDGVYRSSDNGNTWIKSNGIPGLSTGGTGRCLFAKNSKYVFAISWAHGVYRSSDDGANWEPKWIGQKAYGYQDYGAGATSIVAVGEKILISVGLAPFTMYASSDNGDSWIGYGDDSIISSVPSGVNFFHYDNGNLFAANSWGLYISTDSGSNWSILQKDSIGQHGEHIGLGGFGSIVSYNHTLIALVGSPTTVQISRDNGHSWTSFNDGLRSDWYFSTLAIKPPYIWVLRYAFANAYRRPLAEIVTEIENNNYLLPNEYSLSQNYPNPFNPTTKIKFELPERTVTKLIVYDILGREVSTLVNQELEAGYHEVKFNAGNLSSGIYFYRIRAGGFYQVKKMILMK